MKNQWAQYICQKYLYLCHSEYDKFSTQHFAISSYTPIYLPPKVFSIDLANSFTFKRSKISLLISFRTSTIYFCHYCACFKTTPLSVLGFKSNKLLYCDWSSSRVLLVSMQHNNTPFLVPNYSAASVNISWLFKMRPSQNLL